MSPALAVAFVGVVLLCLGIALVVAAARWAHAIDRADRQAMQALGGALRVLMGLALVYGADATRHPSGVHAFGLVLVAVGVMVLWVEPERFRAWVDRWLAGSLVWRQRLGGLLAVIVGVFLTLAAVL
mgnify:CR=1 FL=1